MTLSRSTLFVLLSVALASPAAAHHRQTPPLVRLTTSGDTPLPRMASPGNKTIALIVDSALGKKVVSISPWRDKRQLTGCSTPVPTSCNLQTLVADAGDNANPAVGVSGRAFAFDSGSDPLQTGLPGRQVIGALKTTLRAVSDDPTGTSVNPTVDATGLTVAFESTGDLAGTGNLGARQIFLSGLNGSVTQVSQGRRHEPQPGPQRQEPSRGLRIEQRSEDGRRHRDRTDLGRQRRRRRGGSHHERLRPEHEPRGEQRRPDRGVAEHGRPRQDPGRHRRLADLRVRHEEQDLRPHHHRHERSARLHPAVDVQDPAGLAGGLRVQRGAVLLHAARRSALPRAAPTPAPPSAWSRSSASTSS